MTYEEIQKRYEEEFDPDMPFEDIGKILDKYPAGEDTNQMRGILCNQLLTVISRGFMMYDKSLFGKSPLIKLLKENIDKLPNEYAYYKAVYSFFSGDNKKAIKYLKEAMETFSQFDSSVDEDVIINWFLEPFKQGFDGFWEAVYKEILKYDLAKGIAEYVLLIKDYYTITNEEKLDRISAFMYEYPDYSSVKELLAFTYESMNMWGNVVACLETVEEPVLVWKSGLYFILAWSCGKYKDYKNEETYYRKCLEDNPSEIYARNNLAYSLYKQKRYPEAKEILESCLADEADLPESANNYVRVLIAMGRYKDAKSFVKSGKYKIFKSIRDRVKKLENTNARVKKNYTPPEETERESVVSERYRSGEETKKYQFSSEKILEDELTARIEEGIPVFGKKLRIFRRRGIYGRQFIIPIGRLDLLCEDENGDLYIIELKKDSGYDDAYKQTSEYLDWFEKNEISKGKKVYGIICLNSPTEEIIEKVHSDSRMKLFEYQISYKEI